MFCKDAGSAVLAPAACDSPLITSEGDIIVSESGKDIEVVYHDELTIFGIQSHLDIIAIEELRILVLGLQIFIKEQCNEWLEEYTATLTSINNHNELLTKITFHIKKELHIIGGMSIQDKLQDGIAVLQVRLEYSYTRNLVDISVH